MDAVRVARRVVASLQAALGEHAVIVYDPTYYPELARNMQSELNRAGVYPIIALTFDAPEVLRAQEDSPADLKKREEQAVSLLHPVFEKAGIFLWLPARRLSPDLRWERLLDGCRARGIHFHWISPLAGRSAEELETLTRMYERAVLETDYGALSRVQDRLIGGLRGQLVRITTAAGTDLRMRVSPDAWFHKNDGDMSAARAGQAKSVRDREMEFPCGALRFIPEVPSVEGKLALQRVFTQGGVAEGVTLEFQRGRATRWSAEKNQGVVDAARKRFGGDIDRVGEVVLGTNPLLVASLPSGDLPYYGYGAGYVRVSLGDNWESGGTNRSAGGRPWWLFPEGATLEAGSQTLILNGQLLK